MKRLSLLLALVASLSVAQTPTPNPAPSESGIKEIYVPYEQLEKVFTDGGKGVFLPYREFLDLWNQLQLKREEDDKPPPTDGVISRADYTGSIEGQTLTLTAKLTAESFKTKGWTTLALGNGAIAAIAQADTGKAVLRTKPDGSAELLLPEKGSYDITLQFMLPVVTDNGTSTIQLALPRASVSKLVINVPGDGLNFQVKPSAAFTTRALAGQTELSFFFGGSANNPELTWGIPQAVTQMTPLLLSDTKLESTIHSGSIATTATFSLNVLRAPMNEFKIGLPANNEVLGVAGQNIKTWNVVAGVAGRQTLIVTPDKPIKDGYTFSLNLESPIAALPAEVNVPDLVVEGASYARGSATLRSEPQFDVTPKTLDAVVRDSTTSAPPGGLIAAGGFRLLKQPYKLGVTVEEAKPQVEVSSLTRLDVQRDAAKIDALFNISVRRVGIFETRIGLPSGLQVSEVTGSDVAEWKVDSTGTTPVLVIKLPQQKMGDIAIKLSARQLRAQPTEDLTVPVFEPQNVARHEAKLGITVHSSLEANTKSPGDLQQEDAATLNPVLKEKVSNAGNESTIAFHYRDAAKPAVLSFKARDPQVTVQVLTLVEALEQSTKHTWTLDFNVAYAAINEFTMVVPKAIAGQIRLIDPSIKEIKKNKLVAAPEVKLPIGNIEDYDAWIVVLRSEKIGSFQLSLTHEQLGTQEAGKTGKITLHQVHLPWVFQEVGQVAVLKDNALELRNAQPEGLEEIDARELTGPLARAGVFQAYKYRTLPIKLAIETAKNAYFPVPQAIITHADLTTGIASDEAQTTEVIYWVKNIDLQFLVVKLPAKARLVSDVHVGKESQQPMRREGSDELLVRLPTGGTAQRDAFAVRFVFQVDSPSPGKRLGSWGSIAIQPTSIADVKVLETRHRLFLPEGSDYTAFDGPLQQAYSERGWPHIWRTFKQALWYAPVDAAFALVFRQPDSISSQWTDPPQIANEVRSLFDFQIPQQGHIETLRRLGAPADITAQYRSHTLAFFWEALAFAIVAGLGWWGNRWPAQQKMSFLVGGVLLAMLVVGLFSTANAVLGIGMIRALGAVMLLWLGLGAKRWFERLKLRRSNGKPKPPPPTNGNGKGGTPPPPAPPSAGPAVSIAPPATSMPVMPVATSGGATTMSSSGPTDFIQVPEISPGKDEPKQD